MKAELAKTLESGLAQCRLCRHFCRLAPGERGKCGVRVASASGELETLVGEGVAAFHVDPVEKKPLYHYLPGSLTFSFGTEGCNFDCAWCQNDDISRRPAETGRVRSTPATPAELAQAALAQGCDSVAFTYTEPTVFFELMAATADEALANGLGTIMVSNGYQSPECLEALRHRIQAANIDLKTFRDASYQKYCGGGLEPVLDNLRRMKDFGWWLEVTTLVVPGVNDDPSELRDMARFIRNDLGTSVPWHLSAFHPCRHMTSTPPTPLSTLAAAADIGREEGLDFVYVGNVAPGQDYPTRCPACQAVLITRRGFQAECAPGFPGPDAACPQCGCRMPGVWSKL